MSNNNEVEIQNTEENIPNVKCRSVKNVVVISLGFMMHFAAYFGTESLQSSINYEYGLGTASLAAMYAGFIFSSTFISPTVIKWLGTKWTICVSFMGYMPYIVVQPWPRFYTMIPTAILVGLAAGPLWCAKCVYLTRISETYSKLANTSVEVLLPRFFGLFFAILQCNALGGFVSSLVLSSADNEAAVTSLNASQIRELCGANFLPSADAGKALQEQPAEKIQVITGIFLAWMIGAVAIVAAAADPPKRHDSTRPTTSGWALLAVTLKLLSERNQQLLVILNVFLGIQVAFFNADVTAAFVSCTIGTGTIGYFMMAYRIAEIVGSITTSLLFVFTGRIPLLVGAGVAQLALLVTMIGWTPDSDASYVIYILAVLWGLCNAVWCVQFTAYYGVLFPGRGEAAFSNHRLWESVGMVIAYIMSPYFRIRTKIYVQIVMLVIGMACYLVTEYREKERKRIKKETEGVDNVAYN